jgi:hypothetical protein
MNDSNGVAYCPIRHNPFQHVQYADFSQVQYLQIVDSEDEEDQLNECT